MIVFPAVDIKNGRCVRLLKGRPETAKEYVDRPWKAALQWEEAGAEWIHVVDLDGALSQSSENSPAVKELMEKTSVGIQFGGGIRNGEDIEKAIGAGARRVVLGTSAVKYPDWTIKQCLARPGQIVIALDAVGGVVSIEGWQESSGVKVKDLAKKLQAGRPAAFLYTDVERDGMLSSSDFDGVRKLLDYTDIPVIASGGVSSLEDIIKLGEAGADGVITGKALYEGKLKLEDALDAAGEFDSRL